jgi:hypothetical protein
MSKHSLDGVSLFSESLTIGAVTAAAQRVHHAGFEKRDGWCPLLPMVPGRSRANSASLFPPALKAKQLPVELATDLAVGGLLLD